jgi:tight adherence protein C
MEFDRHILHQADYPHRSVGVGIVQWIYDLFYGLVDDPQMLQIAVVVLAGVAVAVFAFGILLIGAGASDPIKRRLAHFEGTEDLGGGHRVFNLETILGPVTQYVVPSEDIERNKMVEKLSYAGFRSPNALQVFYAVKTSLTFLLPLLIYSATYFLPNLSVATVVYLVVIGAAMGMFVPNIALDKLVERRMKKLRDGFPDALDLLVVCVESGLGLTQALKRVADEIIVSHSELGIELSLVNAEIGAGIDQVTALRNFADRTGLDDVKGLVSLLVQTLKFGTGVADSLRVYAAEFRDKRMQRAEEQAAKIGTKLIFPLILFMFPGFFIVALGPAVIRLMSVFEQF